MPKAPFKILIAMQDEHGETHWISGTTKQIMVEKTRDVPAFRDEPCGPWQTHVDAWIDTPVHGWQHGTPQWPEKRDEAETQRPLPSPAKALPSGSNGDTIQIDSQNPNQPNQPNPPEDV